jgi:hypothetical protein
VATVLGAVAGLVWVVVRGLRFGPPWWRAVSMPLGAGIVIGGMLVHADGVDFTLLGPPALAVGLTIAVPVLATVIVTALGDRWIGSDHTVWQVLPAPFAWVARAGVTLLIGASAVGLVADLRLIL